MELAGLEVALGESVGSQWIRRLKPCITENLLYTVHLGYPESIRYLSGLASRCSKLSHHLQCQYPISATSCPFLTYLLANTPGKAADSPSVCVPLTQSGDPEGVPGFELHPSQVPSRSSSNLAKLHPGQAPSIWRTNQQLWDFSLSLPLPLCNSFK